MHEADEHLRAVSNLNSPAHSIRQAFTLMPTESAEDFADLAARMRAVPAALEGFRSSLAEGIARNLPAGPRQVETVVGQITEWTGDGASGSWFAQLASDGPEELRTELDAAAAAATAAYAELRDWLRDVYAPAVAGSPDTVGRERYARWTRLWNGTDLDLDEAYAYGWSEFHRLHAEMVAEAGKILPDASPWEVLHHLEEHGQAVEGVDEVRAWLQDLMDEAISALDGTHFELADRVKRVESRIAPPGGCRGPVLHRAVRGLHPARPHLAAHHGPHPLPALRPGLHLVPRGCSRSPPPARAVGARRRGPLPLPGDRRHGQRQRGGLGPVRGAADGRTRASSPTPSGGWATSTPR